MTQTASITNFFGVSVKEKLKNKRFWTILVIANLLSGPLAILNYYYFDLSSTIWIAILASLIIGVLAIVVPLNSFDYLYQKNKIDDVLKLPLTRKQLFFSDYLSGLILYIVPIIGQFVLSMILLSLRATKFINSFFKYDVTMNESFFRFLRMAFFAYLFIIIVLMFLYTLTVLVISCVGNTFEAITASLYINLLIPGVIYSVGYLLLNSLFGISSQSLFELLIYFTSPGGLLTFLSTHLDSSLYQATGIWTLFLSIIVILGILWLSYRNFVRRKAESVGTGFVSRIFYYFVMTSLTLLLAAFLYQLEVNFITSVSILAFIFLTFEVITNRGFQKFYQSILRFAIISAIAGCSIILIDKTEGFGLVYRTTDIANVKSVTIRYSGIYDSDTYAYDSSVTLKNPENIKAVLEFHQRVLDDYKESQKSTKNPNLINVNQSTSNRNYIDTAVTTPEEYYYVSLPTYDIEISFDVKYGIDYKRSYNATFDQRMLLASIDLTDEFIDQLVAQYYNRNSVNISDVFYFSDINYPMTKEKIKELYNCLARDMKNLTEEEYLTPAKQTRYKIEDIPILESYTETLAFLENNYVQTNTFTTEMIFNRTKQEGGLGIAAPSKVMNDNNSYSYGHFSYLATTPLRYASSDQMETFKEDIITLLEHAQYQYVTTTPCYRILIGRWYFVIPPEYSDIAAQLYNNLQ